MQSPHKLKAAFVRLSLYPVYSGGNEGSHCSPSPLTRAHGIKFIRESVVVGQAGMRRTRLQPGRRGKNAATT